MDSELLELLSKLKEEILNSEEYKNLLILNKEVNNSEEVLQLAFSIKKLQEQYEDTLRFDKDNSKKLKELESQINKENQKLNNLEIVKKYNKAYQKLKEIYDFINDEIIYKLNLEKINL